MRITLVIIATLIVKFLFGQPYTNDDYVQNFYVTCKTENFLAFSAINTGTELLGTMQYSRAINKYSKALEIDSNCCDALYMLGYCYQRQGNLDQSIYYCNKSISINSNNPSAWTIKGTTLLMQHDSINAMVSFENAKKYASDKMEGYGIALTYYRQKNYQAALAVIGEFEQISNKSNLRRDIKKMEKLKTKMTTTH